jgi:hypothetical protein
MAATTAGMNLLPAPDVAKGVDVGDGTPSVVVVILILPISHQPFTSWKS